MEDKILKLAFFGDFCSYIPNKQQIGQQLQKLIDQQNLNIINFEGCLQYGTLHTAGTFFLEQSHDSPQWLINHGFNVINLANNHAYDWGEEGLRKTKDAFSNVRVIGCGKWEEAYRVSFFELQGFKLGLFVATSADLSALKDKWTDETKFGCPWINHLSVNNIIKNAKLQCDYLFIMVHAGVEYMSVPLPEWRDRYRNLIDMGADVVIATHPHVLQGMEYYNGKAIFYSLGNFCFDKGVECKIPHWNNGLIVCIELSDKGIHIKKHLTKLENHEVEIDHSDISTTYFNDLCALLDDKKLYMKCLNKEVLELCKKYESWLLNGLHASKCEPKSIKGVYRYLRTLLYGHKNYRVALHQVREESTRWLLARAYKLLSNTNL